MREQPWHSIRQVPTSRGTLMYLPWSKNAMVSSAITESGAESMKDMGKVMNIIRPKMQGRADAGLVSGLVKNELNK